MTKLSFARFSLLLRLEATVVKAVVQRIVRSPKLRLSTTIIGTILVSIVSNIYVFQIAPSGVIKWHDIANVSALAFHRCGIPLGFDELDLPSA